MADNCSTWQPYCDNAVRRKRRRVPTAQLCLKYSAPILTYSYWTMCAYLSSVPNDRMNGEIFLNKKILLT